MYGRTHIPICCCTRESRHSYLLKPQALTSASGNRPAFLINQCTLIQFYLISQKKTVTSASLTSMQWISFDLIHIHVTLLHLWPTNALYLLSQWSWYWDWICILRWGTSQLEPTPHPANLSHMVLAFLPLQLSLRYSSPHLVDRPTQLICISDIYLFICQQTNTKDIALLLAGQSATPHHGFPLISLARYPPPTGWFVEAAKRGDLWFLSGMPNSWQKIDARWLHIWTLWFITCVFLGNISIFLNSCISNKWENWKIVKC